MKIGLSSAVFYPNVDTEDSLEIISKLGFECAEIFLNSFSEYSEEFIDKLIYEKSTYNISINSVHAFSSSFEPYIFDAYKRRRMDMIKNFKKVCKAGNRLGAICYTFHGMRYQDINTVNKKLVSDIYNELTYIALENNIKLAQENVSWCMSSNLDFLKFLKETCKYDLFFTLDIKQAYRAGIEPYEYINVMGEKLVNFHINDRDRENTCLLPGRGNVDYSKIVNALKKNNYCGNGIVEVYRENYESYGELKECKKKLEKFLK
ncbi:sugar phosphate isomerase/epimerase family protein [Clostridium neuense]|uniref:Sugar phosphate isomerase/epimerase family protein n=1 Tax=Clostridium neuense TaxID=1728934 RepID=A0ABW8TF93_9CLOT